MSASRLTTAGSQLFFFNFQDFKDKSAYFRTFKDKLQISGIAGQVGGLINVQFTLQVMLLDGTLAHINVMSLKLGLYLVLAK